MMQGSQSRRTFLHGIGGTAMALPFLESLAGKAAVDVPKRMVCVGYEYSLVPKLLYPKETGKDYSLTPLLKPLAEHRNDFTLFSGLDHGITGGHLSVHTFLSGIKAQDASGRPEGNVSVDQKAALHVGVNTRYPSLQLSPDPNGNHLISWSTAGAPIPPITSLQTLYSLLFKPLNIAEREHQKALILSNASILDLVKTDADYLMKRVSRSDQQKLDRYFTSVREVERKLTMSESWLDQPKPAVDYQLAADVDELDYAQRVPIFYDLMTLALQTDSTRVITYAHGNLGKNSGGLNIDRGYHTLTHHGQVESTLNELLVIEQFHTTQFSRFLDQLKQIEEPNGLTLLDNTITLMGSGLGNASSHSNRNLPLLLAGGGFKHQGHLSFDKKPNGESVRACNLYLSMLQQFGIETDEFNTATGTLAGFSM